MVLARFGSMITVQLFSVFISVSDIVKNMYLYLSYAFMRYGDALQNKKKSFEIHPIIIVELESRLSACLPIDLFHIRLSKFIFGCSILHCNITEVGIGGGV